MLVIRQSQLKALGQVPRREYEAQLADHFALYYPRECRLAGPEGLRRLVGLGIDRARGHDYLAQREASLYINLMIMLGSDFDRDPQIPWAGTQVADKAIRGRFRRIQKVHQSAVRYLDQTVGDDNQHIVKAMLRLRDFRLDDAPPGSADLGPLLERLYPQKVRHQGAAAMQQLVAMAATSAQRLGIVSSQGAALFTGLMFMLGVGFASDPLYPWAGRVLAATRGSDEPARVEELHREAISYLTASLDAGHGD